mmetsp:Transcript_30838/g.49455  ORF Transcript_30838/g.49455 Transcript_30838/m.49455 type:complete len:237 (+) Transcript_30838:490-1200(+)
MGDEGKGASKPTKKGSFPHIKMKRGSATPSGEKEALKINDAKVVMLGAAAVGKTSLVYHFSHGRSALETPSTIGVAFSTKVCQLDDGSSIKFQIWDTAGQEQYHSLSSLYYRSAQAALVVYDITNEESFKAVKTWVHELATLGPAGAIVVVIGNKTDLVKKRRVSIETAQGYAESRGAWYIETSAKDGTNVEEVFNRISLKLFERGRILSQNKCDIDSDDDVVRLDKEKTGKGTCC